jgi:hypothetical protein
VTIIVRNLSSVAVQLSHVSNGKVLSLSRSLRCRTFPTCGITFAKTTPTCRFPSRLIKSIIGYGF